MYFMRTSIIIFSIIFLAIGGLLYFVPTQEIQADTTTIGDGNADTRTSFASVTVPREWAFISLIIGLMLLIFGLALQDPYNSKGESEEVSESEEDLESDDGDHHKHSRENTVKHTMRKR